MEVPKDPRYWIYLAAGEVMALPTGFESSALQVDQDPSGVDVEPVRVANVRVVLTGTDDVQERSPRAVTPAVSITADVKVPDDG